MSPPGVIELLRHRRGGGLPLHRVRSRVSSFVYGNITVLGALVAVTPGLARDWSAVLIVAATAVATFIGHVAADLVADRVGPLDEQTQSGQSAQSGSVLAELRDALPIVSAGSVPVGLFVLAALGVLTPELAAPAAAVVVVARLALTGVAVERVSGRRPSALTWWSGFGLALVAAAVAMIKGVAH